MFDIQENGNRLQIIISSEIQLVDKVLDCLESGIQNLESSQLFALKLIAKELLCNAISHGNQNKIEKSVTCIFIKLSNQFLLQIEDQGEGFDIDQINWEISEDASNPRNRGLAMVNHYADSIEFNSTGSKISAWFKTTQQTQFELIKQNDCILLSVIGNLGVSNISELERYLNQCMDFDINIHIDIGQVFEIDSMAIGALLSFGYNFKSKETTHKIKLLNIQKEIEILLNFVHANKFYEYLASNEETRL